MYAVVDSGGKQYRVEEGQVLRLEKIEGEVGEEVVLERVVLLGGEQTVVGAPVVEGARVVAKIVEQGVDRKVTVLKYKPKVRYRRKRGHRQPYTAVRIERIET
ncbi:MAG: 50S ribosomal protein L21 [Armatimonadota bacterium]|nr:50S ribosomal protein L21 [Armatimonadota bacterium]MDR5697589.1 50S ribosomal protein L21 [Armatimonadota bacterium]